MLIFLSNSKYSLQVYVERRASKSWIIVRKSETCHGLIFGTNKFVKKGTVVFLFEDRLRIWKGYDEIIGMDDHT